MNLANSEIFVCAYIECALWSSSDDNERPLDNNYRCKDLSKSTLLEMRLECEEFISNNLADLSDLDASQCGHDFWLNRNGHGAGFWDRGYGDIGDRLSDAAEVYGGIDLYVTDTGEVSS